MTRRARILIGSLAGVAALAALLVGAALLVVQTSWGHERVRRILVSQMNGMLGSRGHLYVGRLDWGLDGRFVVDSVAILDDKARVIAAASRVEADGSIAGFVTSNIHLTRFLIVRPYLLLERTDSVWNTQRLFETQKKGGPPSQSRLALAVDSSEVRDGHIILIMPDSLPSLPPVRRDFSHLQLLVGPTQLRTPGVTGGIAPVRQLAVESTLPPIALHEALGAVRWFADSLSLDLSGFRLPASHGTVAGTISWLERGPARLDLRIHADTVSLADVAWITTVLPKHGDASTDVRILSAADPRDVQYVVSNLDLRATKSRITGGLTATVGRQVTITNLALEAQPLDLDLVREIFGDSIPKRNWQGALTGTINGRGGPLRALRLDSVRLTYADHRLNDALSHVAFSGELGVQPALTELHDFDVRIEDLDIRTLGAIWRGADSVHGKLTGRIVLDGPTRDLGFHDLALTHVDGDRPRSHVSGKGRLASDVTTRWLDATLSLDTLAIATLARGRSTLPLQGVVRGAIELHATRDTMSINTTLNAGQGTVHFVGTSLIDSTRTWVRGAATLQALDPRVLIARKEIPFLRLDGTSDLEIDGDARRFEGHVDIALDTTSRIGDSQLTFARVRSGVDSTGFHVDTAEIHAADWSLSARGRLAKSGATHDSLEFRVQFDSLAPLHALLLDSAGAARADSLHGAFTAKGVLVGSLDTLAVTADFGVTDGRIDGVTVRRASGHAALERLPSSATGAVTFTADSVEYARYVATRVQARADVRDGRTAHITADVAASDTLSTRVVAEVQRGADTTRVSVDSLGLVLGVDRWLLAHPTHVVVTPDRITVDSTLFRSAHGATLAVRAVLPNAGPAEGALAIENFGPAELAFTNLFSPDLEAHVRATVTLTGTRDAPHVVFTAGLDSVAVNGQPVPSASATGTYANRRMQVDLRSTAKGKEIIRATGDLPMDLTLRSVSKRLLDDSLTVKIHADSATLAGLEAVIPNVEGLGGTVAADVDVRGTWKQVKGAGTVHVRDGAFVLSKYGTVARGLVMDDTLVHDSVRVHLRMSDGEGPRNVMSVDGALWIEKQQWLSNLTTTGRGFRVVDDPRLATAVANWFAHLTGPLRSPALEGDVALLTGSLVIGQQHAVRSLRSDTGFAQAQLALRKTNITSLRVLLGNDVRLKSRAANVHLTGEVEVSGTLADPYVDGEIYADRGTYLMDLGVLKRTFRVDSGTVRIAGRREIPATIDLWTSYVVRRADAEDITIIAHLMGTSEAATLNLASAELGTSMTQSEIISYLVFGAPSFGFGGPQQNRSIEGTATAALVPSLGGVFEGALGSVFPFFSSLQVATIAGAGPQSLTTSPLDGLLNSFALVAGRQVGTDSYLNLAGGICRGSRLSSTQSPPGWSSFSVEYRPKRTVSGVAAVEPVGSACNGFGRYQYGLDLFREWKY